MFKLMIFDDEYYFRQSMKTIVDYRAYGFELIGEAGNGESAYYLIMDKKPDLALVDINMPIMNGLELIEQCFNEHVKCQFILITGYAEFEYAQKALKYKVVNYLLKPINPDELIHCLIQVKDALLHEKHRTEIMEQNLADKKKIQKEFELNQFVSGHGRVGSHDEESSMLPAYIATEYNHYVVAIVEGHPQTDVQHIENMKIEGAFITAFYTMHQQLCLIINMESGVLRDDLMEILVDNLQRGEDEDIHIFLGNVYSEATNIILSYHEALLASKSKTNISDKVIPYDQFKKEYTTVLLSDQAKNQIVHAMMERDENLAQKLIAEVFHTCKLQNIDYGTFVIVSIHMIDLMLSVAFKYHLTNYWTFHHHLVQLILHNHEIDRIEKEICNVMLQLIQDIPENHMSDLVAETVAYIQNNYPNPELNIKMLSRQLHINYNYLCSRFKMETGMTINHYIHDVRMSKAKQYFDEGMQAVTLVANRVGYTDIAHFSKSFKKKFGVSPAHYHNMIHANGEHK